MTTATENSRQRAATTTTTALEDTNPPNVMGETEVVTEVIAAIAGHAASEVEGVAHIGGGNMFRRLSDAVGSDQRSKGTGIAVEAGKKEAIFDLDLSVKYGRPIPDIAREVRSRIVDAIGTQVGLRAKEINITVSAIEFGDESGDSPRREVE